MSRGKVPSTKIISIVFLIVVALLSACSSETPSPEVIAVTSVEIHNPGPSTLVVGSKVDLSAEVIPENATDKTVTWKSSDESVATVDASGLVLAVGAGNVTIAASAGNTEDSVVIKVVNNEIPAESVILSETSIELLTGSSTEITATVLPEDSTSSVVWESSDSAIASVRDGVITAHKPGVATITAYAGDERASCTVSVDEKKVPATGIKLDTSTLRLALEGTYQVKAIFEPANAEVSEIIWTSSNEEIAVVDEKGIVTAKSVGETEITAASGNLKASCLVTVAESITRVTISLSPNELSLDLGESEQLNAKTDPADAEVVWSSDNENVATVDQNGNVTAKSVGKATVTVTATEGGAKASCIVTINEIPVTSIIINGNIPENLQIGDKITLTAVVEPDNATNPAVRWSSSNTSVARVDGGNVSIVGSGTATITATAVSNEAAKDSVTIDVRKIAVESITLDKTNLDLDEGDKAQLTAALLPENATDKTVTWESSNEKVATVVNGIVTAVSTGEATISAKAGDKTASCTVTVSQKVIPVESISLNKTSLTLEVGKSETLTASVSPENATDKTITWESSNVSVVAVEDGVVMAVSPGNATITAKVGNIEASCLVTVNSKPMSGEITEPDKINPDGQNLQQIESSALQNVIYDIISVLRGGISNDLALAYILQNQGTYDGTAVSISGNEVVFEASEDILLNTMLGNVTIHKESMMSNDIMGTHPPVIDATVDIDGEKYYGVTAKDGIYKINPPIDGMSETDIVKMINNVASLWSMKVMLFVMENHIVGIDSPIKTGNVAAIIDGFDFENISATDILASLKDYSYGDNSDNSISFSSEGIRLSTDAGRKVSLTGPLTVSDGNESQDYYFDIAIDPEFQTVDGYVRIGDILYEVIKN